MRGVKAVLYVAVLVCLISSSFAACTNGKVSPADATQCMCQSGYYLDQQCTGLANLATTCTPAALSRTEANHFPSLSTDAQATKFVSNTLYAIIEGEYVNKRQYEELMFANTLATTPDARCALGVDQSFWGPKSRSLGSMACNDSFTLTMPWSSHRDCGFANNTKLSTGDYMYITGYLHIKYTDDLGEVENFTLTRSTKVPYSITVRFQRHVTVDLKALNVSSDVKYGMALTEDVYDPTVSQLTLELTTIVNWPNMFYQGNDQMKMYLPDQVLLLQVDSNGAVCTTGSGCTSDPNAAIYTNAQSPPGECQSDVQDSICKQTFTWKAMINTNSVKNCTFDGEYNLEIGLYTCRAASSGSPPDCTNQRINITYTIQDSFVCGEIGVTPSVTGDLYAFPPSIVSGFRALVGTHDNINQFSLGTYGNFYAKIDSDDNVISIKFTRISFKVQGTNDIHDLYVSSTSYNSQYVVVHDNSKYFNVYFHSSIFKVNPNSQVVYTFTATADVSFQGNDGFVNPAESKKRTVEFTWTQASAEASTNVFMAPAGTAPAQVAETPAGVSSVTFIASVVGAVAGTMIIVFVVVGFALRARSNKDEVSSSLLAASAAASEVANRA